MSQRITINLPDETKAALDNAVREDGVSESALVERALKDYLFIRKFRSLRQRLLSAGLKDYEERDILDQVS